MANKKVLHIRSTVVDDSSGKPKLPTAGQIDYGEIAINYAKGKETFSIKNEANEIVSFGNEVFVGSTEPEQGSHAEIFIDESENPPVLDFYSKNEVDEKVTAINGTINNVKTEVDKKVICGTDVSASTISSIFIDESINTSTEIYSKEQIDKKIARKDATSTTATDLLVDETDDASVAVYSKAEIDEKIARGSGDTLNPTALLVDESASASVEVYTKAEVDSLFAKLKQLNPDLVWN